MSEYEHTQKGTVIRVILGVIVTVMVCIGVATMFQRRDLALPLLIPASVTILFLWLFHSLTVRVTSSQILLSYGPGLIRKSFRIDDVQRVSAVRNRWYYGWGIRKIWGGWLYNVSGLDAVQLEMRQGKINRIGTDEPQRLLAAIEAARSKVEARRMDGEEELS